MNRRPPLFCWPIWPARSLLLGFFHRALGGVGSFLGGVSSFGCLVGGNGGVASSSSVGSAFSSGASGRSGVSSAFSSFHRAVSGTFDGRCCVFGGGCGVVGSLFTASGEAHRGGKDERQSDRFFHLGNPSRFEQIDRHRNRSIPEYANRAQNYPLGKWRATPFFGQPGCFVANLLCPERAWRK